jgi:hypothetical protein
MVLETAYGILGTALCLGLFYLPASMAFLLHGCKATSLIPSLDTGNGPVRRLLDSAY